MSVYQSSRNAELELLKTLQAAQGLKVVGCRFYRGLVGGIGVSVPDRAIGFGGAMVLAKRPRRLQSEGGRGEHRYSDWQ